MLMLQVARLEARTAEMPLASTAAYGTMAPVRLH
jgi:hypothetical protein